MLGPGIGCPPSMGSSCPKGSRTWLLQVITVPAWPTIPWPFWFCLDFPETSHSSAKSHLANRNQGALGGIAPLARWGCLLATWKQNNIIHPLNNCPAQETYLLFCLPFPGAPTYASSDGLEVEDIWAHFQLLNVIFLMILEKLIDHLELVAYQSKN